jgi:hypothetical protein
MVLALLAGGTANAAAAELGGWTQPLSPNPLCQVKVTRVYQAASGQVIHVVINNLTRFHLRFDLDVILDNGRTGETRQISGAELRPEEIFADFQTNTGYSTTGKTVKLRLDSCSLD